MEESSASRCRFLSCIRGRAGRFLLLCAGTAFFWQVALYVGDVRIPHGPTIPCTLIGCSDQVSLTVRFPDRRWPTGVHEVDVRLPDAVIHCRFTWPTEEPVGRIVSAVCDPPQTPALVGKVSPNREEAPVRVELEPELGSAHAGGEGQIVPQHFLERITVAGTPAQVWVLQKVNGVVMGEQTFRLAYNENEPNGSSCGPVCRQASAEWELRALSAVSAR